MGSPEAAAPADQAGQSQSTQGTTSRSTPEDGPIETGDEGGDPEHSVAQQLNGMNSALKKRDARGALYWAASALQKLQMSPDQALKKSQQIAADEMKGVMGSLGLPGM
jgi:hypothetical protein